MIEKWRPVVGFEDIYEVSDQGRIRSLKTARVQGRTAGSILKPRPIPPRGYLQVTLRRPGKRGAPRYVHDLVLSAFVGPRPAKADACHYPDPSPVNCCLSNLRWDTRRGNLADKIAHGTWNGGESHHAAKLSEEDVREIFRLGAKGLSQVDIARQFPVSSGQIHNILLRKCWKHLITEKNSG